MHEEFKSIRQSMGLNQQALADLLGVTQATVSRWEAGIPQPDKRTMIALRTLQAVNGAARAA